MEISNENNGSEYIAVKAQTSGVQVIGMTRGSDTRPHHTEQLDNAKFLLCNLLTKLL